MKLGWQKFTNLLRKTEEGLEGFEELCDLNRVFLGLSLLAAMRKAAILTVKGFPTQRNKLANRSKACIFLEQSSWLQ